MSQEGSPRFESSVSSGLDGYVQGFISTLPTMGYAPKTQYCKRWLVVRFARCARRDGLEVCAVDEAYVDRFLARRRGKPCKMERATLRQFLEHLRAIGVAPPRRALEPSSADMLLQRYCAHLGSTRGLCVRSVEVYAPFARAFIKARGLPERITSLDAAAVRAHLVDCSRNRLGSTVKLLAAALRSFLCFLFSDGMTQIDFSKAVPPVRQWRMADIPPRLSPEEVEQVIATTDRSTTRGCRAHAMLLLLARLGLRAAEVAALQLDDVRWDVGEIVVRGKGRRHDRLPLPHDVGEALTLYLRDARGPSSSRCVFLRRCAPHVGLSGPTAVCLVARRAVRRAGLMPTGRVGAHIFRHSLATRMLQSGASLAEIAQLLRHRSLATTQLYAKVELEALSAVALPWPISEVRP